MPIVSVNGTGTCLFELSSPFAFGDGAGVGRIICGGNRRGRGRDGGGGGGCEVGANAADEESNARDVAAELPALFRRMLRRMDELQSTAFSPDRGPVDPGACDAAVARYGGWWGPWSD